MQHLSELFLVIPFYLLFANTHLNRMYELVSPVNLKAVIKYLAQLTIGIGAVLVVPLAVALLFADYRIAVTYGIIASVAIIGGYLVNRLLPEYDLEWKEAFVVAALIFPISSLVSAIPFMLSTGMCPLDAFFEAVSGVTTTGLSVAPADAGAVFLFARSWLQWIGGIGIVLIVLSVPLIHPGTSAVRLYAVNISEEKLRPSVASTAMLLAKIYLAITFVAILLLLLGGMTPFDAVCHALASVSTGGFSTRVDSIAAFPGALVQMLVLLGCIMGTTNFALFSRLGTDPRRIFRDPQLRALFAIAGIGVLLLFSTLIPVTDAGAALGAAIFQVLSALSTAGFSTVDIGLLPDSAKAVLTLLMWIGGSAGSTAGGIKILRLLIMLQIVRLVLLRFFLPREALTPLKIGDHVIEQDEMQQILSFTLLYLAILVISSFLFMLHGFEMGDALFEVSSALGTVGLSCGITGPAMPVLLKLVLIADMLLGRIEIIPLVILFMPRTWIKR
jgi:trk system potassium uptake protein TrkH